MSPIIIYSAVFFGVAALVGAVAFFMSGNREAEVEERLNALHHRQERRQSRGRPNTTSCFAAMRNEGAGAPRNSSRAT